MHAMVLQSIEYFIKYAHFRLVSRETMTMNFNLIIVYYVGPGINLVCHYGGFAEPYEFCAGIDFEISNLKHFS